MAITTIGGTINSTAVSPNLDYKYGPYNSLQDAYDALGPNGIDKLTIGLTVGIIENGEIDEYWFKDGTELENLVKKSNADVGTINYTELENKPSINSVTLSGNKNSLDLGLQSRLISGTNIKTINSQNILGSGNLNTINNYINVGLDVNDDPDFPTPSADYQSTIALVPSIITPGSLDYYICVETGGVWNWELSGNTAPIINVQAVDVTSELIPTIYTGKCFGGGPSGGGSLVDLASSAVYEYNVDGLEKVYVSGRSWITSASTTTRYFVGYYDENGYITGLSDSIYYPFNDTPCILTNEEITLPQGTKYIRLNESSAYTDLAKCVGEIIIGQSLVKSQVTPNTFIYGTVRIDQNAPENESGNTEITTTQVDSAFGVMFPSSYTNIGKPTQVIAMLHGSAGCVTPDYFGYDNTYTNWPIWRQQYLDAGFAVMDINGYGVSSSNDIYSQPNGNPQSVETLDKAFEFIKMKYNVCDKLLLHGTSMGGANAMSYLLNHPNKVAGVGLFAPEIVPFVIKLSNLSSSFKDTVSQAWGYLDATEAIEDGFSKVIGYAPFMEDDFDWENMTSEDFAQLTNKTNLANVPIRIWQGDEDTNIPYVSSQMLVSCLKRANIPVSLRTCVGGVHNLSGGAVEYVRNEAVNWFKRFII